MSSRIREELQDDVGGSCARKRYNVRSGDFTSAVSITLRHAHPDVYVHVTFKAPYEANELNRTELN